MNNIYEGKLKVQRDKLVSVLDDIEIPLKAARKIKDLFASPQPVIVHDMAVVYIHTLIKNLVRWHKVDESEILGTTEDSIVKVCENIETVVGKIVHEMKCDVDKRQQILERYKL